MASYGGVVSGRLVLKDGDTGSGVRILSLAEVVMQSGSYMTSTTISNYGKQTVGFGAVDDKVIISAGGKQYVSGVANNTNIKFGGVQNVNSRGLANSASIGGTQTVGRAGSAYANKVGGNGALQSILAGGRAELSEVYLSGVQQVQSTGVALSARVFNSGSQVLINNGIASQTLVSLGGSQIVSSHGHAVDTTILDGGSMFLSHNASATNTFVSNGGIISGRSGTAHLLGQTIVAGRIRTHDLSGIGNPALTVDARNSEIVFAVDMRRANYEKSEAFVDYTTAFINVNFTIRVSSTQATGRYHIAYLSGRGDINLTYTVKQTDGTVLGTLRYGGSFQAGGKTYSLIEDGSALTFRITDSTAGAASDPPEATGAAGSPGDLADMAGAQPDSVPPWEACAASDPASLAGWQDASKIAGLKGAGNDTPDRLDIWKDGTGENSFAAPAADEFWKPDKANDRNGLLA